MTTATVESKASNRWKLVVAASFGVVVSLMALFAIAGRFNDGGWYLYAARLAGMGKVPYRDFLFPQPPLALYLHAPLQALSGGSVLCGRLTTAAVSLVTIALAVRFAGRLRGWAGAAFVAACFALNGYTLYYLTIVKTYPLAALLLLAGGWACVGRRYGWAQAAFVLATLTRLSAAPALLAAAWMETKTTGGTKPALARLGLALGTLVAVGACLYTVSEGRIAEQLYLPLGRFVPGLTAYYVGGHEDYPLAHLLVKKLASLFRTVLIYWLPACALAWGAWRRRDGSDSNLSQESKTLLTLAAPVMLAHLLANRPYEEYHTVVFPLLCVAGACAVTQGSLGGWWRQTALGWRVALLLPLMVAPVRGFNRLDWSGGHPALVELWEAAREVHRLAPSGDWLLTLEPYLAVESKRSTLPPELLMGRYAYHPEWSTAHCRRLPVVNEEEMYALLASQPGVVALSVDHFTTANPRRERELRRQFEAFEAAVAQRYPLAATFEEFGYARTPLRIFGPPEVKSDAQSLPEARPE